MSRNDLAEFGPPIAPIPQELRIRHPVELEGVRGIRERHEGIELIDGIRERHEGIELIEGLREEDEAIELGIRVAPPRRVDVDITEEKYEVHPRAEVRGAYRKYLRGEITRGELEGIFDIFKKALPATFEFCGRVEALARRWALLSPRISKLHPQQQGALNKRMEEMRFSGARIQRLQQNCREEVSPVTSSRFKRLKRQEAALPIVERLVSEFEVSITAPTPEKEDEESKGATTVIIKEREEELGRDILRDYVLPGAAVLGAAGTIFGLGKILRVF